MSETMQMTIRFTSDWHIGSGSGIPGGVDRAVLKDADGLPFIPGKTLTGVLRDSAEFVAGQLGGTWGDVVIGLFGNQPASHGGKEGLAATPAKLCIGAAALPNAVRSLLKDRKKAAWRDSLYFVQPGVAIDPLTRRAEDKKLFFTEKVRGGLTLSSSISLRQGAPALTPHEKALLLAAVAATRRLGGGRRRGAGACCLAVEGKLLKGSLEALKCDEPTCEPMVALHEDTKEATWAAGKPTDTNATDPWVRYRLTLTTKQPLLIAKTLKGNVLESLRRVPGTLLLGLMTRKLSQILDGSKLSSAIAHGDFVVTDLLPLPNGAEVSYPAPACFSQRKDKDEPSVQGAGSNSQELPPRRNEAKDAPSQDTTQYKPIREGWVGKKKDGDKETWCYYSGKDLITQRMHNTVEDKNQRPTEAVGGVYTYEAIAPQTVLVGECLVRSSLLGQGKRGSDISTEAEDVQVGRSLKDDYGAAILEMSLIEDAKDEPPVKVKNKEKGDVLVLWLQSPMLVRNQTTLSYHGDPRDLEALLKQALDLADKPTLVAAWGRTERIESWHGPSNRPRPSLLALAAGSVYRFELGNEISQDVLQKLQEDGLGERRAEGYGRVLVNHPLVLDEYEKHPWSEDGREPAKDAKKGDLTKEDKELLRKLDLWHGQEVIRREARKDAYGNEPLIPKTGKPSNAQVGALRSACGHCVPSREMGGIPLYQASDLKPLQAWAALLEDTRDKDRREKRIKNLKDKWGETTYRKVIAIVKAPDTVWDRLKPENFSPLESTAWEGALPNDTPDLRSLLTPFAVITLLEQSAEARFDEKDK